MVCVILITPISLARAARPPTQNTTTTAFLMPLQTAQQRKIESPHSDQIRSTMFIQMRYRIVHARCCVLFVDLCLCRIKICAGSSPPVLCSVLTGFCFQHQLIAPSLAFLSEVALLSIIQADIRQSRPISASKQAAVFHACVGCESVRERHIHD
jgi:hypothetical protein